MGLGRFVLIYGVIGFGMLSAVGTLVLDGWGKQPIVRLIGGAVFGGFFWGITFWYLSEWLYNRARSRQATAAPDHHDSPHP